MLAVGLTGGIGSGKSAVADLLVERGAVLIDADQVARDVVAPGGPAYQPLIDRFGPGILDADGTIDRKALAAIAFADDESRLALNAITHPAIGIAMIQARDALADTDDIVVLAIPLLTAVHRETVKLHKVVVVDTPTDIALERLLSQRGFDRADAEARIRAQISREERVKEADYVLDNSGDRAALEAEVATLWDWLRGGRLGTAGARLNCHTPRVASRGHARIRGRLALPALGRPAHGHHRAGGRRAPGRPLPDAAGHHRLGQDGDDRLDDRAGPAPDPHHRAQQVAGRPALLRAAGALPQEPGRVLRLLLRLLPARGVPADDGHLHREGLVHQRRDRPAPPRHDLVAPHAARRHRGGVGVVHLRPGLARRVPGPHPRREGRRAGGPARHAAPPRRPAVRPQRREPGARHLPGAGRHGGDPPGLRGAGAPRRDVRRHHRPHRALRRHDRGDGGGDGGRGRLRRHALRHRRRHHPARRGVDRGGAAGAPAVLREGGQAARGPAPAGADRARPRDAGRDRRLLGRRELQPPPRRPGAGRDALHAPRLLPQGLPLRDRREPRRRPAAARAVRRRQVPQGRAGRARLPAALGPGQPAAPLRGVHRAGAPVRLRLGHAGRLRARALRRRWWSR